MAGDLEDFLRRAAERRQQKAAPQPKPATPQRQRPQYSDRRTERVARIPEDEVLVADVVETPTYESNYDYQLRKTKAAQLAAAKVDTSSVYATQLEKTQSAASDTENLDDRSTVENLIRMMQQPNGIQQAILLREILDRPEHRWD